MFMKYIVLDRNHNCLDTIPADSAKEAYRIGNNIGYDFGPNNNNSGPHYLYLKVGG